MNCFAPVSFSSKHEKSFDESEQLNIESQKFAVNFWNDFNNPKPTPICQMFIDDCLKTRQYYKQYGFDDDEMYCTVPLSFYQRKMLNIGKSFILHSLLIKITNEQHAKVSSVIFKQPQQLPTKLLTNTPDVSDKHLHIPLKFWFTKHTGMFLPTIHDIYDLDDVAEDTKN